MMIQPERIRLLNNAPCRDRRFVLYWMQAAQRAECNHALEHAVRMANELGKPLVVFFGLTRNFPEANARHYAFMIEGLREVEAGLKDRGVQFVVLIGSPDEGVLGMAREACVVVVDRGYLRVERRWRKTAARRLDVLLVQVETNVVVPIETASPKEEYAAATLRPKIHRVLRDFLIPLDETPLKKDSLELRMEPREIFEFTPRFMQWNDMNRANSGGFGQKKVVLASAAGQGSKKGDGIPMLTGFPVGQNVTPARFFRGGASHAQELLEAFLREKLSSYDEARSDPTRDALSHMSPYLHFGQVSPLEIALEVRKRRGAGVESYLEELIVRRELSMNFVFYNDGYDKYEGLPDWCLITLARHKKDKREYVYGLRDWESAGTHDPYWNAAQREMMLTGKMHGYMRMYWGKKILEWSETPKEAFHTALHLNNKYELDGRDPNGFAGVAWCFGKHDRAWPERRIFGKVRYMNAAGLLRKFDADAYVRKIEGLADGLQIE